jgi:BlaI family penicillinase repressor
MPRRRPRSKESHDTFLPEAELETLAALHQLGEAEAAQVREALASFRPMTHASMATLLRRLEERGLVEHRKAESGRAFLYRATVGARSTYRSLITRVLERVFRGDPLALFSSLVDSRPLDERELARLRTLVDELGARRKKR